VFKKKLFTYLAKPVSIFCIAIVRRFPQLHCNSICRTCLSSNPNLNPQRNRKGVQYWQYIKRSWRHPLNAVKTLTWSGRVFRP